MATKSPTIADLSGVPSTSRARPDWHSRTVEVWNTEREAGKINALAKFRSFFVAIFRDIGRFFEWAFNAEAYSPKPRTDWTWLKVDLSASATPVVVMLQPSAEEIARHQVEQEEEERQALVETETAAIQSATHLADKHFGKLIKATKQDMTSQRSINDQVAQTVGALTTLATMDTEQVPISSESILAQLERFQAKVKELSGTGSKPHGFMLDTHAVPYTAVLNGFEFEGVQLLDGIIPAAKTAGLGQAIETRMLNELVNALHDAESAADVTQAKADFQDKLGKLRALGLTGKRFAREMFTDEGKERFVSGLLTDFAAQYFDQSDPLAPESQGLFLSQINALFDLGLISQNTIPDALASHAVQRDLPGTMAKIKAKMIATFEAESVFTDLARQHLQAKIDALRQVGLTDATSIDEFLTPEEIAALIAKYKSIMIADFVKDGVFPPAALTNFNAKVAALHAAGLTEATDMNTFLSAEEKATLIAQQKPSMIAVYEEAGITQPAALHDFSAHIAALNAAGLTDATNIETFLSPEEKAGIIARHRAALIAQFEENLFGADGSIQQANIDRFQGAVATLNGQGLTAATTIAKFLTPEEIAPLAGRIRTRMLEEFAKNPLVPASQVTLEQNFAKMVAIGLMQDADRAGLLAGIAGTLVPAIQKKITEERAGLTTAATHDALNARLVALSEIGLPDQVPFAAQQKETAVREKAEADEHARQERIVELTQASARLTAQNLQFTASLEPLRALSVVQGNAERKAAALAALEARLTRKSEELETARHRPILAAPPAGLTAPDLSQPITEATIEAVRTQSEAARKQIPAYLKALQHVFKLQLQVLQLTANVVESREAALAARGLVNFDAYQPVVAAEMAHTSAGIAQEMVRVQGLIFTNVATLATNQAELDRLAAAAPVAVRPPAIFIPQIVAAPEQLSPVESEDEEYHTPPASPDVRERPDFDRPLADAVVLSAPSTPVSDVHPRPLHRVGSGSNLAGMALAPLVIPPRQDATPVRREEPVEVQPPVVISSADVHGQHLAAALKLPMPSAPVQLRHVDSERHDARVEQPKVEADEGDVVDATAIQHLAATTTATEQVRKRFWGVPLPATIFGYAPAKV
jgi:hypothetical protein